MAENTAITWCDSTFNPWMGCTKVSPACDHCYAERLMDTRWHKVQWGSGNPRRRTGPATWRQPLLWEREHEAFALMHGRRRRVFCASLADVFDNEVEPAWRVALFALIAQTPHLDWLLLTKRIGNAKAMLGDYKTVPMLPNIWLGATVINQEEADRDIPKLLAVPVAKRFLSIEPMLGPVNLRVKCPPEWQPHLRSDRIAWVICGGESGTQARPMHPDWVRALRDQCEAAGVAFHFKQFGEWLPSEAEDQPVYKGDHRHLGGLVHTYRVGTKAAGRLLDGIEHNGFPAQ